jgi:hypothetical protein
MKKKLSILLVIIGLAGVQTFAGNVFFDFADGQNTETEMVNTPKIFLVDKTLKMENISNGLTVEIYSVVGSRVQVSILENGVVDVSNLSKGIYIVRVERISQKIVLK